MFIHIARRWRLAGAPLVFGALLALSLILPLAAQETTPAGATVHQQAQVVVQVDAQAQLVRAITFTEAISGLKALELTGLEVVTHSYSFGDAVCSIAGVGCPAEDCFCSANYWSYWYWEGGAWQGYPVGAGNSVISQTGAVEGWRWGLGTVDKAEPPPVVTFADICGAGAAPVEGSPPTSLATATTVPLLTRLPADDVTPPVPAEPPASPPVTVLTPRTALTVLLGVLVALPLAAFLIAWGWRSGRRKQP